MTTAMVSVEALTATIAISLAIEAARQTMFDPLRVLSVREVSELPTGYRYTVEMEGIQLTEGEARELYGK